MSVTRLFASNRSLLRRIGLLGGWLTIATVAWPQAVPSQANIDASAQQRLQETARQAQRQRRIEDQIRILSPALSVEKLSGSGGSILARKALASLVRLREEGVSLNEAIARATRAAGMESAQAAKPAAYLRNLFVQKSGQVTPAILAKLEIGEDPAPDLVLSPFVP